MEKSLDQRFKEFLSTLTGVENIDNLNMTQQQNNANKADYFAENRQLIIELKSFETDTEHKVEKILESHRSRPEFPDFFGKWEVNKVLKYLPDGKEINERLVYAVTSSLRTKYKAANGQIKDTKSTFNLPDSQGLLIILNERIDILSPDTIFFALREVASSKYADETFKFVEINSILLVSEAHFSPISDDSKGFPIIHMTLEAVNTFSYENFIENLKKKWAEFNNARIVTASEKIRSYKDLDYESVSKNKEENTKVIHIQDSWVKYYKWNPYFRSYDEKMLLWMFKIIMIELAPGFLKGASQQQKSKIKFWIEVFPHFMEEVNHRGIDMKFFAPIMKELGKETEKEMKEKFPDLELKKNSRSKRTSNK